MSGIVPMGSQDPKIKLDLSKEESTLPKPLPPPSTLSNQNNNLTSHKITEIKTNESHPDDSIKLFVKTTAHTFDLHIHNDGQTLVQLLEKERIYKPTLIFAGKILDSKTDYNACIKEGIKSESTLHVISNLKLEEKPVLQDYVIGEFRFTDRGGAIVTPKCPKKTNLKEFCDILCNLKNLPKITLLRIFHRCKELTVPELLSKNIFEISKEYRFDLEGHCQVFKSSLDDNEIHLLANMLKEKQFPGLPPVSKMKPSTIIQIANKLLWSNCDRIFRGKYNLVNPGVFEKYIEIYESLLEKELSFSLQQYVSHLLAVATRGLQLFKQRQNTLDEVLLLIESDLSKINSDYRATEESKLIEFKIKDKTVNVNRQRLIKESPYFCAFLSGNYKESPDTDFFILEDISPLLGSYLTEELDFEKLSVSELGGLLESAQMLIFPKLSLLCQKYIIQKIKKGNREKFDLDVTLIPPYLNKAFMIANSIFLYRRKTCLEDIELLKVKYRELQQKILRKEKESSYADITTIEDINQVLEGASFSKIQPASKRLKLILNLLEFLQRAKREENRVEFRQLYQLCRKCGVNFARKPQKSVPLST